MTQKQVKEASHVVIIHRWTRAGQANYERYIDHGGKRVTYVTTAAARASVPMAAAEVITVADTGDIMEAGPAVDTLAMRHGKPDYIIAMKEPDLLVGCALRTQWGCPGPRAEQFTQFRDKFLMVRTVADAGIAVPDFSLIHDARSACRFAGSVGWPVVIKPLAGRNAAGVVRIDDEHDLRRISFDGAPLLAQKFNPHPTYHADGVFASNDLVRFRASRYINSCLEFRDDGIFLGSVEEDDPELNQIIAEFTLAVMKTLTSRSSLFHLELFVDNTTKTCEFLEVGARVGGGEIPFLWRELHGYDLMETMFCIQQGLPVKEGAGAEVNKIGGWLLVPAPDLRPCTVVDATPMAGRVNGPYAESLQSIGTVFPKTDPYYQHIGGRFRFSGISSDRVEQDIKATAAQFRLTVM